MAELFDITSFTASKSSNILDVGTVYQEVGTLTTPDLPAGLYMFGYSYALNLNNQKNQPAILQVTGRFAGGEFSDSIGDNDVGGITRSYSYPFTHPGGIITTGIQMRKSTNFAASLDMLFMDIMIQRIG